MNEYSRKYQKIFGPDNPDLPVLIGVSTLLLLLDSSCLDKHSKDSIYNQIISIVEEGKKEETS